MIAGLLLAAGASRRFGAGASKLLQPLAGRPVVRWSAEALRAAVDRTLVVVPPSHAALARALSGLPVDFVTNPGPERGIGHSIACGVAALPGNAEAVVVALADEPAVQSRWVAGVIARYLDVRSAGIAIVAPSFRGVRRHPVLFDRAVFAELAQLAGDRGARAIVDRDPGRVSIVQFEEPGSTDVDTPEDLARLRRDPQFTARPSSTKT